MADVDQVLEKINLDNATLTVIVTDKRAFILESFIIGAGVYLVRKYCDGFLKGIGKKVEALGEANAEAAVELLAKLRSSSFSETDLENEKRSLAPVVDRIHQNSENPEGKLSAEATVREFLQQCGVPESQAKTNAKAITSALFDEP